MDIVFDHLPFSAVLLLCAFIGYTTPRRFLTVDRALAPDGKRRGAIHWLREFFPYLIVLCASSLGLVWVDPESLGWGRAESVAYFMAAGVLSLPAVHVARGLGYNIQLPGHGAREGGDNGKGNRL